MFEIGNLVKNFCVGVSLLDDEFVENALQGKCHWEAVFDRDDHLTKKQRNRIKFHSKFEPDYLFQSARETKSNKKKKNTWLNDVNNNQVENDQFDDFNVVNDDPFACLNVDLNNEIRHQSTFKMSSNRLSTLNNQNSTDHLNETINQPSIQRTPILKQSNGPSVDPTDEQQTYASIQFRPSMNLDLKQDLNLSNLNAILNILKNVNTDQFDVLESSVPIKCLSCSYTTTSIQNLFLHSSYHRNVCGLCETSFKSVYAYFHHLGFHLKAAQLTCSSRLQSRCTHCLAFFERESTLLDHFHAHYTLLDKSTIFGEQIIKYKCKICKLVDVSFKSFQDHYTKQHTQIKCTFCEQWLQSFEQLEKHAFHDHRPFVDNNECNYCMQKFTFKTAYENHLLNRHCILIDEQTQRCYLCDFAFSIDDDFDSIVEHLANHCNVFIYNCDTCEFRTNSKSAMISHTMKIVSSDKYVLLANRIDLNLLWHEISKQIQLAQEDVIIKDQLDEAVASIL